MTRIGVLGDTHGNIRLAEQALKSLGQIDLVLHTGDYYRDGKRLSQLLGIEVIGVLGNCDIMTSGPKEQTLAFAGKRIYLTHGHLYGAKSSFLNLFYRGKEVGANLVIYGHTHVAVQETVEDMIILNPGSLTKPRNRKPTYGLVTIDGEKIRTEILELPLSGCLF